MHCICTAPGHCSGLARGMLDPSSSEEESDELVEEESSKEALAPAAAAARLSPSRTAEGSAGAGVGSVGGGGGGAGGLQPGGSRAGSVGARPCSPSPSVVSEKEKEELERLQKEEEERKRRLQLYVFVMRCIAYPFNAKQPTDMARRQQKVPGPRGHPGPGSGRLCSAPGLKGRREGYLVEERWSCLEVPRSYRREGRVLVWRGEVLPPKLP